MNIEEMSNLPKEVITFLNENEFILFKDAMKVVDGSYPFMKYYTNGGE